MQRGATGRVVSAISRSSDPKRFANNKPLVRLIRRRFQRRFSVLLTL